MGELVGGRADMALFPLTMTSVRSKYISATSSFMARAAPRRAALRRAAAIPNAA